MSSQSKQTEEILVGILGATGMVGQRFIQLLSAHPYFRVSVLGASPRSAGKSYKEATTRSWKMDTPIPEEIASMTVALCDPTAFKDCKIIFSGLDAEVAGEIEMDFLKADFAVFSNAKNHRMAPNVPLMVPLVNTSHFDVIAHQRQAYGLKKGFLVTNANCSTTGLVVVLAALIKTFGPLSKVFVVTMQAISGSGYPGIPSIDILGNVVPYISGEEEKIESECAKILGSLNVDMTSFVDAPISVSASCNRVPVIDGHTESIFVEFERRPAPSLGDIAACLATYTCEPQRLLVPSAPENAIILSDEMDRPQPRLDINLGKGNSVIVGRLRKCKILDTKLTLLSHNTILGAAGSSIMNAETAVARGLIS